MNLNHTVIFSLWLELKSAGSRVWGQGLGWSRWPHLWQTAAGAHWIEMHSTDSLARGHCLTDELVDKSLKILAKIFIDLDTNQSVLQNLIYGETLVNLYTQRMDLKLDKRIHSQGIYPSCEKHPCDTLTLICKVSYFQDTCLKFQRCTLYTKVLSDLPAACYSPVLISTCVFSQNNRSPSCLKRRKTCWYSTFFYQSGDKVD